MEVMFLEFVPWTCRDYSIWASLIPKENSKFHFLQSLTHLFSYSELQKLFHGETIITYYFYHILCSPNILIHEETLQCECNWSPLHSCYSLKAKCARKRIRRVFCIYFVMRWLRATSSILSAFVTEYKWTCETNTIEIPDSIQGGT